MSSSSPISSPSSLDRPHQIPFDLLEPWYRAYARYVAILEEHSIRFALAAGDLLAYDNHRMLHARTPFQGARWVRGVYFDERDGPRN
jgi:alpha-ketoglutarate-dependent taurine dioxygenase